MISIDITYDVWKYDDLLHRGVGKLWDDSEIDDPEALIRLGKKRWGFVRVLDALVRDDAGEFVRAVELLTASFPPQRRPVHDALPADLAKDLDVVAGDHLPPLGLDATQRDENINGRQPQPGSGNLPNMLDGDYNPFTNSPTNHAAPQPGPDEDSKQ